MRVSTMLVFRHVAYEPRELPLDSVVTRRYIYMQPRVINLGEVEVREEAIKRLDIQKDLPQVTSLTSMHNLCIHVKSA